MARSPLLGRRIHIAGSIVEDAAVAAAADVNAARELVPGLVKELVKRGANFVIPVDAEPVRKSDGLPICFDWLVWKSVKGNLALRPANVPGSVAVAVQHHKSEDQIPADYAALWDELRASPLVKIENAAHWNMNSKRMEAQARFGDILVALGGTEGVLYLANLYHDAGKPIVPLNLPLCPETTGARRLYNFGLTSSQSRRLFQVADNGDAHDWINKIRFPPRQSVPDRVSVLVELLEALERPKAFAVRLLNPDLRDYADVQDFFDMVVQPVIEGELGYALVVIDGRQAYDHPRIDQEIFAKLHRSSVVLADITGARPNCFLELGYALGRGLPTMVMAREGSSLPFDITTFSGHHWKATGAAEDRRRAFREHWQAIRNRPSLVPTEPLIS
jgi:TIR- and PNP-associating SLOG family